VPLHVAGLGQLPEVTAQSGDAAADAPAVDLHLGLAWAAASADAAAHAVQALTPAAQPGQQVVELRQLDLRLALSAGGVLGEDVEDQGRAVDHLCVDQLLQPAKLARRELVVHDHGVRALSLDHLGDLEDLALPDEGAGVRAGPALQGRVDDLGTGGFRQAAELLERVLGCLDRAADRNAHQDDSFEPQLSQLDDLDLCVVPAGPGRIRPLCDISHASTVASRRRSVAGNSMQPPLTSPQRGQPGS
jgi:hypothetical protein